MKAWEVLEQNKDRNLLSAIVEAYHVDKSRPSPDLSGAYAIVKAAVIRRNPGMSAERDPLHAFSKDRAASIKLLKEIDV